MGVPPNLSKIRGWGYMVTQTSVIDVLVNQYAHKFLFLWYITHYIVE